MNNMASPAVLLCGQIVSDGTATVIASAFEQVRDAIVSGQSEDGLRKLQYLQNSVMALIDLLYEDFTREGSSGTPTKITYRSDIP